jgi:NADH:ubiquinone oxidoreductase subunit C
MVNYKLLLLYILSNFNFLFLKYNTQGRKNVTLVIPYYTFYYFMLHIKLSSSTYITQLVDIFSYELPINSKNSTSLNSPINNTSTVSTTVVYNLHNLTNHVRFFVFVLKLKNYTNLYNIKSIAELFPNANWLEREVSELYNITFDGKKDTRNLMLQYGDNSAPFQKFFPSIGLKEMFYDILNDLITQQNVTYQV